MVSTLRRKQEKRNEEISIRPDSWKKEEKKLGNLRGHGPLDEAWTTLKDIFEKEKRKELKADGSVIRALDLIQATC